MFDSDTPFRRHARTLKAPSSTDFDIKGWGALIDQIEMTQSDLKLARTALWLFGEAALLRAYKRVCPLPPLCRRLSTLLAIAMLNRECAIVMEKFDRAQKRAVLAGSLSADHLAGIPISHGKIDASSITDAAVDSVDSWLYEAVDSVGNLNTFSDFGECAAQFIQNYSLQRSHYDLWQQALWEDWHLEIDGGRRVFVPSDPQLALLLDACLIREQSKSMEYAWVDISCWPQMSTERRRDAQLHLTVIDINQKTGRLREFIVARPTTSTKKIPGYVVGRAMLDACYLHSFTTRPFPKWQELSCNIIFHAWYVLLDVANVLAKKRPRAHFRDLPNIRQWALVVKKRELIDVFCRTLSTSADISEQIVSFLTWEKGCYKGLWGAPLVPLPGSDDYGIAHSVLSTSNMVRRVEIWLKKGGLDDNLSRGAKGTSFESHIRSEIRAALTDNNTLINDCACAENAIKETKDFPHQIDLLIQIADVIIVAEVKCFLFPADPRERFNFLKKLRKASKQARDKAEAVAERPEVAAKALGITVEKARDLRVVPLIVVNQGFGMSLAVDECVVTDARFLKLYIGSGSYASEAAIDFVNGRRASVQETLYRNASEAAANFTNIMRAPPSLYRFVQRLRWGSFDFPSLSGDPLSIAVTNLEDVSGTARTLYDILRTAMEG